MAVQVNGKLRGELNVPKNASKDEILAAAKALPNVQSFTNGKTIVKEICVENGQPVEYGQNLLIIG